MLRLLADENFDHDLVRGVMRRRAGLDLTRAQSVGLSETDDPGILAWAAREQRIVLTHDVNTMTGFAIDRVTRGEPMTGLFIVHQEGAALSTIIEDLLLLDDCSDTSEWAGQILYLPLR
jgi:predicted nuclease of predicted toxin-antitoxin system